MTQTNNSQPWALTLANVLSGPEPLDMVADAQDIPNVRLEAKRGIWYGHLGDHADQSTVTPLTMTYVSIGATIKVSGVPYSWSGSAWAAVGGGGGAVDALTSYVAPNISKNTIPRIAYFGDSTADCGGPKSTGGRSEVESFEVPAGTGTSGFLHTVAGTLIGRRQFIVAANCGRTGETTVQMLARSALPYSNSRKSIEDAIAKSPDLCIFHGGSINDITAFDETTPLQSFIDVAVRHCAIAKRFVSAGIPLLDVGIYGYDGNGSVPVPKLAAIRAGIVAINNYIATESAKYKQWIFVSPEGTVSTAGAYISGMSSDGTHLSSIGASYAGGSEAVQYDKLLSCTNRLGPNDVIYYDGRTKWAAGTAPTDAPYVGTTNITLGTQTCTTTEWTIPFDVTSATNELLILWTSAKALLNVPQGAELVANFDADLTDSADVPAFGTFGTRCWIYDTASHLNQILSLYSSYIKCEQQFFATVAQTAMGANTRVGLTLNNLPIGSYKLRMRPMMISSHQIAKRLSIT